MDTDPTTITPEKAAEILAEDPKAILVDIRSSMEYLFIGHPIGARHVAWIDEPDWVVNPNFCTEIRKLILGGAIDDIEAGSVPIILICRSGKRSHVAGKTLLENGLKNVYHIGEGFEGDRDENGHRGTLGGWRFRGLPWEQC